MGIPQAQNHSQRDGPKRAKDKRGVGGSKSPKATIITDQCGLVHVICFFCSTFVAHGSSNCMGPTINVRRSWNIPRTEGPATRLEPPPQPAVHRVEWVHEVKGTWGCISSLLVPGKRTPPRGRALPEGERRGRRRTNRQTNPRYKALPRPIALNTNNQCPWSRMYNLG